VRKLLAIEAFSDGLVIVERITRQVLESFKGILAFENPIYTEIGHENISLLVYWVVWVFTHLLFVYEVACEANLRLHLL
jgi:hypothetical protein